MNQDSGIGSETRIWPPTLRKAYSMVDRVVPPANFMAVTLGISANFGSISIGQPVGWNRFTRSLPG